MNKTGKFLTPHNTPTEKFVDIVEPLVRRINRSEVFATAEISRELLTRFVELHKSGTRWALPDQLKIERYEKQDKDSFGHTLQAAIGRLKAKLPEYFAANKEEYLLEVKGEPRGRYLLLSTLKPKLDPIKFLWGPYLTGNDPGTILLFGLPFNSTLWSRDSPHFDSINREVTKLIGCLGKFTWLVRNSAVPVSVVSAYDVLELPKADHPLWKRNLFIFTRTEDVLNVLPWWIKIRHAVERLPDYGERFFVSEPTFFGPHLLNKTVPNKLFELADCTGSDENCSYAVFTSVRFPTHCISVICSPYQATSALLMRSLTDPAELEPIVETLARKIDTGLEGPLGMLEETLRTISPSVFVWQVMFKLTYTAPEDFIEAVKPIETKCFGLRLEDVE